MKTILLLVHDDAGQEARFQAALDLARRFEAHLCCLDAVVLPEIIGNYYGGLGKVLVEQDVREQEAVNRATLEARLAVEQIPWSWEESSDGLERSLYRLAQLADLIVLNRRMEYLLMPDMAGLISRSLASTSVPILAVPLQPAGIAPDGAALVAWDGSPPAAAALRAAIPLLKDSLNVTLYVADDGSIDLPAEDAARYLSQHGIHATIVRQFSVAVPSDELLLGEVRRSHAQFVVMGGYGHSRLAEGLFGGVTRTMLADSPVPLFLAH